MATTVDTFERLAAEAYRHCTPLAERYYYPFSRPSVTCGGVPSVLFLGNHSSGKSSLVNWILGETPVQDVGLAPTDDGFTVILYGEKDEDVCGPAAISRLPDEFRVLEVFGGAFLQHLQVKIRKRELLKSLALIDSPGMIDSAEGTVSRTYDFEGVVRRLANLCDLIFFVLDPEKPGTTGETVTVFSRCLAGVAFKLRVLFNKCDAFSSLYDFARTYGTVCWNLARVLHTKDLPHIWTLYTGDERAVTDSALDLADFNRHRAEFRGVLRDAAARRRDNVFAQVLSDFIGLSIRMCVLNHAARRIRLFRLSFFTGATLFIASLGVIVSQMLAVGCGAGVVLSSCAAGVTMGLGLFAVHGLSSIAVRLCRQSLARRADEIFEREYRQRMFAGEQDNIRQYWDAIREKTADIIRDAPLKLPFFGEFARRRLEAKAKKILAAFHRPD